MTSCYVYFSVEIDFYIVVNSNVSAASFSSIFFSMKKGDYKFYKSFVENSAFSACLNILNISLPNLCHSFFRGFIS